MKTINLNNWLAVGLFLASVSGGSVLGQDSGSLKKAQSELAMKLKQAEIRRSFEAMTLDEKI